MKRIMRSAALILPAVLLLTGCGKDSAVSFKKDVKPIIDQNCVECHLTGGKGFDASGFVVESYDTLMKGTKFGPVIVAGDPLSSSLYRLISGEVDPSIQMPHGKDPLDANEIGTIERWIAQGARNN